MYPRNITKSTPEAPASANQISHVLYQHDPMNTLCNVFQSTAEYDIISDHIMSLLAQHEPVGEVVREVLIFWFAEDLVDRRDRTALVRDVERVVGVGGQLKPLLFANTEFPPGAADIEKYGLFSTQQYLPLREEFFDQGLSAQHAEICAIIRKDVLDTEGRLDELGAIQGYTLYRPDGMPYLYNLNGAPDARANDALFIRRLTHPLDYKRTIA